MIKTAIVGASGYVGLELIKILLKHPNFTLTNIYVSKEKTSLEKLHPSLQNISNLEVEILDIDNINKNCKLVFLATPHCESMKIVKEINKDIKIVDLSADYRLNLDVYEKYYTTHIDKDNLHRSVYGLPEFYKEDIKNTNLIANPGCYPTASLLGILPFCEYIDEKKPIIIDAKSGVSGAGKTPNEIKHFVSVNESLLVYNPLSHRHEPEIKEKIEKISNKKIDINFVATLLPITRGMQCNIYLHTSQNIDALKIIKEFYKNEKFVRIFDTPIAMKNSSGTNFCDIFVKQKNSMIFISSCIDNILRGAASQAVVNANLMFDIQEYTTIPDISHMP